MVCHEAPAPALTGRADGTKLDILDRPEHAPLAGSSKSLIFLTSTCWFAARSGSGSKPPAANSPASLWRLPRVMLIRWGLRCLSSSSLAR